MCIYAFIATLNTLNEVVRPSARALERPNPAVHRVLLGIQVYIIVNGMALLACAHAGVMKWPAPQLTADFGSFRTEWVDAFTSRLALLIVLWLRILYNMWRSPEDSLTMKVGGWKYAYRVLLRRFVWLR